MLFSESELYECSMFKGLAHAYFQAFMLDVLIESYTKKIAGVKNVK